MQTALRFIILTILFFSTLNIYCQQDTLALIDEISNYISTAKYKNVDTIKQQEDDEYQTYIIYSANGKILQIDGSSSGEFISYNFSYYYNQGKLIYSNYSQHRLVGHWSEYDGNEYEYQDREEDVYYYKDKPIKASVIDSESDNHSEESDEEISETQNLASDIGSVNAVYYIEHAHRLLTEFGNVIKK